VNDNSDYDALCVAFGRYFESEKVTRLGRELVKEIARVAIQQERRSVVQPDEDPKVRDLYIASTMLRSMAVMAMNTDPRSLHAAGAALIIRLANALDDLRFGRKPPMFEFEPLPHPNRASRPVAEMTMGKLAAALELLMVGGMKPSDAIAWLNSEIKKFGITDAAGQSISASRVNDQREHYRENQGAARSRGAFNDWVERFRKLLSQRGGPIRVVTAQQASAAILQYIAQQYKSEVAPKRAPRNSGRTSR
jgi:hypothetical protein